jgi:hypothetical protein
MQSIEEVVAKFFLKILPNFVTIKTSTKTFARRCSPCHWEKETLEGIGNSLGSFFKVSKVTKMG